MKVNGSSSDEYSYFQPSPATVTYTMEYECEIARIYAGISIAEWDALPGSRQWVKNPGARCKCDLIMLRRMSVFIPNAVQDAQAREYDRKNRTRRGGR